MKQFIAVDNIDHSNAKADPRGRSLRPASKAKLAGWLRMFVLGTSILGLLAGRVAAEEKPNIIFFLADD